MWNLLGIHFLSGAEHTKNTFEFSLMWNLRYPVGNQHITQKDEK